MLIRCRCVCVSVSGDLCYGRFVVFDSAILRFQLLVSDRHGTHMVLSLFSLFWVRGDYGERSRSFQGLYSRTVSSQYFEDISCLLMQSSLLLDVSSETFCAVSSSQPYSVIHLERYTCASGLDLGST